MVHASDQQTRYIVWRCDVYKLSDEIGKGKLNVDRTSPERKIYDKYAYVPCTVNTCICE